MITSTRNPKVQWVKALQSHPQRRKEENVMVVEGIRLAEEAFRAGWEVQLAWYVSDIEPRGKTLVEQMRQRHLPVEEVAPAVLKAASDTETPQGILMVVKRQDLPMPEKLNFVILPDQIRDPGNLGTILRTASAAGVELVILPPGTVDPASPKVVRSAMGAHFTLPIRQISWEEIVRLVQRHGLTVFLAESSGGQVYYQADFRQPLLIIIGSEAEGISAQARALPAQSIHIPMPGRAESLNAAVAAGILLFEAARQRGQAK